MVCAVKSAVRRSKDRLVKLVCSAGGMVHTYCMVQVGFFRGIEGYRWDQ